MSTFTVTAERLTITPHPGADRLELARVGLYNAVVAKGAYRTGDVALYIPEQAIVPDALIEELGLTGKLAGKAKNRVKAVRLRGEVSQGIVCRPAALAGQVSWGIDDVVASVDYGPFLGIEKWVPEIPPAMAGEIEPAPDLIRWPDIESIKRFPDIFTPGEPVVATEKIHGTCMLITLDRATGAAWVTSKGHGEKSFALKESETNLYWRAVRQYGLIDKLRAMLTLDGVERIALFGEVYGAGVQDLAYGANARRDETLGYRAFDIASTHPDIGTRFVPPDQFAAACWYQEIPYAPVLYRGPYDVDVLTAAASGPTIVGEGAHIREGLVIRPHGPQERSPVTGGRKIAKLVSDDYVLRGGEATEFE